MEGGGVKKSKTDAVTTQKHDNRGGGGGIIVLCIKFRYNIMFMRSFDGVCTTDTDLINVRRMAFDNNYYLCQVRGGARRGKVV